MAATTTGTIVKHMSVVNTGTVAATFELATGGTVAANVITPPTFNVNAGGMAEWDGTMAIGSGETLYGSASAATTLSIRIDGDQVSP